MSQPAHGLCSIAEVRLIELPRHAAENGTVVVAEAAAHVPFATARMFTVTAPLGARRGEHAHRRCSQFMLCVHGTIDIGCTDGSEQRTFTLDRGNLALVVPPTIWNTVVIREGNSVLVVLCDRPYEEHDYIREFRDFLAFRQAGQP
jgi:dTDP-4-dehydrorhamnose 3,5-epimerase-like enzyme